VTSPETALREVTAVLLLWVLLGTNANEVEIRTAKGRMEKDLMVGVEMTDNQTRDS